MKKGLLFLAGIILLISIPALLAAQDYKPGDVVRLKVRRIHIPAHPAPRDASVPFRFESGSKGTVRAVDPESGWIELKGKPVSGSQNTGWIVRSYIKELTGEFDPSVLELDWCLPKSSPTPRHDGRIRIATWNLGNLHAEDGESIYGGNRPSVKRSAKDYERIKCYIRLFDPDILAVQEVDGEEALLRIVDADVYDVHVSDRPQGTLNGMQNTGFAYKRGLNVTKQPDFEELDVTGNDRLRYGARIDLNYNGHVFRLMSVHLKSGCFEGVSSSSSCRAFFQQLPVLEEWIDDAAQRPESFIVLGDFNRRFNVPNDSAWLEIDDSEPQNSDLTSVTFGMPITCRDNRFTRFIDHIISGKRATELVDLTSFRHVSYRQQDIEDWDKISDHCAVVVELWQ